ncbi:hypothetical protein ZWY2020_001610 [Hordeum vulgare]|nr:hypothetical protein ZWY2020_001610 [Hordeum vulgare]
MGSSSTTPQLHRVVATAARTRALVASDLAGAVSRGKADLANTDDGPYRPFRRGRLRSRGGYPWRAPRRWRAAMWSVAASGMDGSLRSTGMVSPTSTSRNGSSRKEPVRRGDDRSVKLAAVMEL